ncbi:KpsF/GutQ family sugar-phosphate isomerase [Candidatus Enterococcus ferrettii]|uniref:SIS domain-containing protein n=1 Tax=Candidatus Enterococcus ferrettii TaxID=2815324 RepID=A0ABV0EU92_9ENTE|nr:SIS domain-containing protein [Enterococcus sp. 665A]MBO1339514.1 SIS domain-containing protein [Enterococcus sp. 665A]
MNNQEIKDSMLNTLAIEGAAITKLSETVDLDVLTTLVHKIGEKKGKIVVSGCGTSGVGAKKIVHSLSCVSIPAVYLNPADAVHGSMGIITEDDIVILISKGGNTKELVHLLDSIKAQKPYIVGVGENETSAISHSADLFIKVSVDKEPDSFNMLATASTLAVISIFDAVCIALMTYTKFTKEQFGINHPGGAVGDRLLGK